MTVLTRRQPPVLIASCRSLLQRGNPQVPDKEEHRQRVWGVRLKKFEAERLLDWLEANGRNGHLRYVLGEGFTVC